MTTKDLISKGIIDVYDDIEFRTHADVMRLFGKDAKILQPSLLKHPHEDGVTVWFPLFYDDANNDWINTASKDYGRVFEKRKFDNEGYLVELIGKPERHHRILFAKLQVSNSVVYKFKGVFEFNVELSQTHKKAIFDRVSTSAKLYPA